MDYGLGQTYLDEGIRILELSRCAPELFRKQEAREKRRFLNFVLSNSTWTNGELEVTYRQPFDIIAEINTSHQEKRATEIAFDSPFDNWLPGQDSNLRPSG